MMISGTGRGSKNVVLSEYTDRTRGRSAEFELMRLLRQTKVWIRENHEERFFVPFLIILRASGSYYISGLYFFSPFARTVTRLFSSQLSLMKVVWFSRHSFLQYHHP